MNRTAYIVHAIIAVALIIAYTAVDLSGEHDVELLALLGGYLLGVATQHGITAKKGG